MHLNFFKNANLKEQTLAQELDNKSYDDVIKELKEEWKKRKRSKKIKRI